MFQRLDRMRKHSFGSVILFGENNKSTISGIWFWRGHDLAFEVNRLFNKQHLYYKFHKGSDDDKFLPNEKP